MLSALLGPLRFEDEEKDAEMGDDEVMEGENEGEKKEGQEGEEAATEKKEESENAEKAPEEGNPENKEENKKPTESVSSEAPKAEKYVYCTTYKKVRWACFLYARNNNKQCKTFFIFHMMSRNQLE